MASFDPYRTWLGILPKSRPLNHYALLGVTLFESNVELINEAYDQRMQLLKKLEKKEQVDLVRQLMQEVGKAKIELTKLEKKKRYDAELKLEIEQSQVRGGESVTPLAVPMASVQPDVTDSQRLAMSKSKSLLAVTLPDATEGDANVGNGSLQGSSPQLEAGHELDGDVSVFKLLSDVRILMALITLTVVLSLVTMNLLSGESGSESAAGVASQTSEKEAKAENDSSANQAKTIDEMAAPVGDPRASQADPALLALKKVRQSADGSFEVPIKEATLKGPGLKKTGNGICEWTSGSQAAWMLVVADRRSGYFHCHVTYRAAFEAPFEASLGERKPIPFTVYPHKEDFEEQFIVRLGKGKEQPLRIVAGDLDFDPELFVKRITLKPTR